MLFTIFDKVDCEYSDWGVWGKCDKTCGGGTHSRRREPVRQGWYGRVTCTEEDSIESAPCNEAACPGDINLCNVNNVPYLNTDFI